MAGTLLDAALQYAQLGYAVFPCAPGGKEPITKNGHNDASTDEDVVGAWWEDRPDANIGIATFGLVVVDVDGADNKWPELPEHRHDLAAGAHSVTPRGGSHHVFRQPDGKKWRNTAGRLANAVDTRADGGYIVVPPSIIGDNGYNWIPTLELSEWAKGELAEPPPWLIEQLDALNTKALDSKRVDSTSGGNMIPDGQRNQTLANLAGSMRRVGMSEEEIYGALIIVNRDRCNPPIPDAEVHKIAWSVGRYEPDQSSVAMAEEHFDQDFAGESTTEHDGPGDFPEHLLNVPGFINEVTAFNLETAFKPQPLLALAGAIALMATLTARKIRDPRGNRTNCYILSVAPSGRGKDHARKVNRRILYDSGQGELEGCEEFASDSGLIKEVEVQPAILFQVDEIGRMLAAISDPRAGAHLKNIQTALIKLYSNANTVFRGKAYADNRRNAEIDQPCVSIHGMTVPEHLYNSITPTSLSDGFLARLMIFESDLNPERVMVEEVDIPKPILETAAWWGNYNPGGGNLQREHPTPWKVEYSAEAVEVFNALAKLCDSESGKGGPAEQSMWARAEEKACRLALVYACSRAPLCPEIDKEAATWACEVSTYLTQKMLWVADQWVAQGVFDAKQKRVVRMLRAEKGNEMKRNSFTRKTQDWTVRERAEVIENMKASGVLREISEETKGRPLTIYKLR